MSKRRAPGSGLKGAELFKAISTLEELERLSQEEELEEVGAGAETSQGTAEVASEKIKELLALLKAKVEGPLFYSFSSINFDILDEQLKISPRDDLVRKGDHVDRVAESAAQGGGKYMTSEGMYHHLNMLENLVPKTSEAGTRLWIDAIFFRVSAMLSGNKCMVLSIEQHVPSVGISGPGQTRSLKLSGMIDYAAFTTDPHKHDSFIHSTQFQSVKLRNLNGFFVTEAKQQGLVLTSQVPQAVAEMYASAKYLNKLILCGALSNGHEWIFLIFYLNEDGIGGTYAASPIIKIQVNDSYPYHVLSPGPDIVVGILAYWMEHSFVDLDENDWFSPSN